MKAETKERIYEWKVKHLWTNTKRKAISLFIILTLLLTLAIPIFDGSLFTGSSTTKETYNNKQSDYKYCYVDIQYWEMADIDDGKSVEMQLWVNRENYKTKYNYLAEDGSVLQEYWNDSNSNDYPIIDYLYSDKAGKFVVSYLTKDQIPITINPWQDVDLTGYELLKVSDEISEEDFIFEDTLCDVYECIYERDNDKIYEYIYFAKDTGVLRGSVSNSVYGATLDADASENVAHVHGTEDHALYKLDGNTTFIRYSFNFTDDKDDFDFDMPSKSDCITAEEYSMTYMSDDEEVTDNE